MFSSQYVVRACIIFVENDLLTSSPLWHTQENLVNRLIFFFEDKMRSKGVEFHLFFLSELYVKEGGVAKLINKVMKSLKIIATMRVETSPLTHTHTHTHHCKRGIPVKIKIYFSTCMLKICGWNVGVSLEFENRMSSWNFYLADNFGFKIWHPRFFFVEKINGHPLPEPVTNFLFELL